MKWLKRAYDAAGLTQYPVGPHLEAVQAQFGGSVMLCLDVSGSMAIGSHLAQAARGCEMFVRGAVENGYSVGGVLWHHDVERATALSRDPDPAIRLFHGAVANGGNNIVPTLRLCEAALADKSGDRVIAIFGDGDLGDAAAAAKEAERLTAAGIRVLTCGLGGSSAEQLGAISSESTAPRVATTDGIAQAIAGMTSGLRRRR